MSYVFHDIPATITGGTCDNPHDATGSANLVSGGGSVTKFTNGSNHNIEFEMTNAIESYTTNRINGTEPYFGGTNSAADYCFIAWAAPCYEATTNPHPSNKYGRHLLEWSVDGGSNFYPFNQQASYYSGTGTNDWERMIVNGPSSGGGDDGFGNNNFDHAWPNWNPAVKGTSGLEYEDEFVSALFSRGMMGSLLMGHAYAGDPEFFSAFPSFSNVWSDIPWWLRGQGKSKGNGVSLPLRYAHYLKWRIRHSSGNGHTYMRNLRFKVWVSYCPLMCEGGYTVPHIQGTSISPYIGLYHSSTIDKSVDGLRFGKPRLTEATPADDAANPWGSLVSQQNRSSGGLFEAFRLTDDNSEIPSVNMTDSTVWGENNMWSPANDSLQLMGNELSLNEMAMETDEHSTQNTGVTSGLSLTSECSMSVFDGYSRTVLCTEMYNQGKLDKDAYDRDKEMTDTWMLRRPLLKAGYLSFAHWPLWMLKNKREFAEKYMHHVIKDFSYYYADKHPSTKTKYKKNNWVGKSMMVFGLLFFPPLGLLSKISSNKYYRTLLSTITTSFWFFPLLAYSLIIMCFNKIVNKEK